VAPVTGALRIVPLGGLGEIGMNCMAIEAGGRVVVVDCGVMFPDREIGVDVVHPAFDWLLDRRDRIDAIVITHGHEDHIGGLPYLLRDVRAPVYGPPYALGLVRRRLEEHDLDVEPDLRDTVPRRGFRAGAIEVEPIRVTHSIADATALVIRTEAGTIVHTGDFKIDLDPTDGEHFDEARLDEIGREGVRLLLSDSTNAWVDGTAGSERAAGAELDRIVRACSARVVIASFASNVHRLRAAFATAEATGRHVCLLGRSMRTHVEIAVARGYLRDPGAMLVSPDAAQQVPRRKLMVLATGTQAEPAAALARLAAGDHQSLTLEPGDTAILSARTIPGCELAVVEMINALLRRGVEVRFPSTDPGVHVSGHACRNEQRRMIELTMPRAFVPVHGTLLHMTRHAALAAECGVAERLVVENGAVVSVGDGGTTVAGTTPVGRVHVVAGEEIPDEVLRDRALLGELGIATAVVTLDARGRLVGDPEITTRGVLADEDEPELLADARRYVGGELSGLSGPRIDIDVDAFREAARRALARFFGRALGRKPLTAAVVVRTR
jgi:ribonuclease J